MSIWSQVFGAIKGGWKTYGPASIDGPGAFDSVSDSVYDTVTAEKAMRQQLLPGTISSDVHQYNVNGPVFDLVTTLSKFLSLGMTLEQVIARATTNPAKPLAFREKLGTLREGAVADVAVFSLEEGRFEFTDSLGARRTGNRQMVPVATMKSGRIYGSASIPVEA